MAKDSLSGSELISQERYRQKYIEGWTAEHDKQHDDNELLKAARCYIDETLASYGEWIPPSWPWGVNWWKPSGRIRNLVKAGALIAAEIDRIQNEEV